MRVSDPQDLHALRRRVLREDNPEAAVANPRDDEDGVLHLAGWLDDRVVACASWYPASSPVHPELLSCQLRYAAVDFDVQGRGFGSAVLERGEALLVERGVQQLWANARDTALDFYLRLGWIAVPGSAHLSAETGLAHTVIVKVLEHGY